jgi:N-acetylmuramoyl-L-alanine amidase
MLRKHKIKQGECISDIAFRRGLLPKTIWDYTGNADLRNLRHDLNILLAGDTVFIPDKRVKQEQGATEQKHRFRRKGVPEMLRLRLLDEDRPRDNVPYVIEIEGSYEEGTTDSEGRLQHPIPPDAKKGKLILYPGEPEEERLALALGYMDPMDEISGVQARLANLGFDWGPPDGDLGPRTRDTIAQFQTQLTIIGKTFSGDFFTPLTPIITPPKDPTILMPAARASTCCG